MGDYIVNPNMFLNEQLNEFLFPHIGDMDVQYHEDILCS